MVTDNGRAPSGQALVASDGAATHLHPTGFDPSRWLQRLRARLWHVHEWHDWYVFDSSANVSERGYRVCGQQIMMLCECGATERKHLPTWREARLARKRLPYKRWGIWRFSLPVPDAIARRAL